MVLDNILEDVACLEQKDLLQLRDTVEYLLNTAHVDPEISTFLDIIKVSMKRYSIKYYKPYHSMQPSLKTVVIAAESSITEFCNRVAGSRTEKIAAMQQLVDMVVDYIKNSQHIPLSFATVVQQCKNVESIFDTAYPNYREGGMAHILFTPSNKIRLRRRLTR